MTIEFDPEIARNAIWLGMLEPANREIRERLGHYGNDAVVNWTWFADIHLRPCFRLNGAGGQPTVSIRFADFRDPVLVGKAIEDFAEEFRELRSGVIPRCPGLESGDSLQ